MTTLTKDALAELRHDLRTPLNAIIGYSEILTEDAADAGREPPPALAAINSRGQAALELINTALAAAHASIGAAELATLHHALHPLATAMADDVEQLLVGATAAERPDLEKIRKAAQRLLQLATERLTASASGGLTPPEEPPVDHKTPAHETKPTEEIQPAVALPQGADAPRAPYAGASPHLLVVDDVAGNRDLLRRRLEPQGYEVTEAADGRQALALLGERPFDLVLLDIMMPEIDGYQVLQAIKGHPTWRSIPVIMISALDEIQSVVRCIEMGAEDYLSKPFDPVLLRARVGACLEKKRLADAERRRTIELEQALARLKATQDQLIVQEKLASLGALTAGIAHEIKNPLNFVMNFAQATASLVPELRDECVAVLGSDSDQAAGIVELLDMLEQNVAKIHEHGKRADGIVRGMLEHSRGQKGERRPTDLNALVDQYLKLAYHGMRGHDTSFNVDLQSDYDRTVGSISLVPQDFSRVILNICNNACYAAHERTKSADAHFKPTVKVSTHNQGESVEIRVRDNGVGVPLAIRDKIFQPFFTTKPTGSGTGLGLSISYDIVVQEHHGAIAVDSVEGQYTEFTIRLPRELLPR